MEERARTVFTERGLTVDGLGHVDVFAGAMHYWRVDRDAWRRCLLAMKGIGLRIVDTYVPWGEHEVGPGTFDWKDEYDLGAFLDEVATHDMLAIVRPGPVVNAELTYFGLPERVVRDQAMQAQSSAGGPVWLPTPPRMFPVPSYASRVFQTAVRRWYAALGEVVAPRLAPHGPVVAVQIDNEMQMFFRLGVFDHDYHPDALTWWEDYAGGAEAPRAWSEEDAERCLAWAQFKEEYVARSLSWMREALTDAGIHDIATYHNLPPADPTLVNLPRTAAAAGLAGMDFYHRARDWRAVKRRALYLVGSAQPLPLACEVGVGGPPWLPPMTPADQQDVTLSLLAAGVRGLCFFMAVERERYYGAAIAADGTVSPHGQWLGRLAEVLAEVEWTTLRRRAPVALLLSRADSRAALASSVADPLTPVLGELLGLGPAGAAELARDPRDSASRRWVTAVEDALALAQVPYHLVDEDCPLEVLQGYRAVILPTAERVDRAAWKRMHEAADAGVVVVLGPDKPGFDERDAPLGADAAPPKGAGFIRAGSADDLEGLADDLLGVAGELDEIWIVGDAADVDCALFEDAAGAPRVLIVSNCGSARTVADVIAAPGARLRDPLADETLTADEDGAVDVALGAFGVRLLVIEAAAAP